MWCPFVWPEAGTLRCYQSAGLGKCHKTCSLPTSTAGSPLLSQPFLTPILELWCSWGVFLIVEVESCCVSKKKFVHFSRSQCCCIQGLCNLILKNPCKCFSGSKLRPRQANYLFKVTEADVRVPKVGLLSAGLPTSDTRCPPLEDFPGTHRLGGFTVLGFCSGASPQCHLLARVFCTSRVPLQPGGDGGVRVGAELCCLLDLLCLPGKGLKVIPGL